MSKAETNIFQKPSLSQVTRDIGELPNFRLPMNIMSMKAKQCAKIGELREALLDAGVISLDKQAAALGLSRSTTWALLKRSHKGAGLSASTINRILNSPALPPKARHVIEDYVERKSAGTYGHREQRLRMFRAQLNLTAGSKR